MKKQRIISGALALTMAGSMYTTGVLAEELTVTAIKTGESVLDDVTVTFSGAVSDSFLTKENFAVTSEGNVPNYEIVKDGNDVTLKFAKELDYDTTYTVSLKNVVAEESTAFTTEANPMILLFEEDFSTAESVNRFINTGMQERNFGLDGGALLVDGEHGWTVGVGPVASIKGSETWKDYELTAEYKTRRFSSPILLYRQAGVDTSKAEKQTHYGYLVSGGSYAAPEDIPEHLYIGWQNIGTGGGSGTFSEPYTNAGSERWYGMRVTAIGNSHKAENYDIATGAVLNSIEREIADYNSGAVGFAAYYDFTYWDNIKVIDKGFNFDVEQKKNVKDKVVINFNADVDASSVTDDKFTVSNSTSTVDIDAVVIDEDTVELKLNDALPETVYNVTISKDVLRASDSYSMNNDKTFEIKTAADENIKISGVTPADAATDVDILSDIRIIFTSAPAKESLADKITVTSDAEVPEYEIIVDGNDAVLTFDKELDYEATYTVTVASGIENVLGNSLENGATYTFTTQKNDMLILFEEDFSTAESINRFTNTGMQERNFGLDGTTLLVDGEHGWTVGVGPVASIKGSESWKDYELTAEYKTRRFSSPILVYRQLGVDTSKAEKQTHYGYLVSGGSYAAPEDNPAHLYIGWQNIGTSGGSGTFSEPYTNAGSERWYGMRVTAIGNSHKAENYDIATGVVLNSIEREIDSYNSGAVGFAAYYDFTYWDNIKVIDKGFMFDTTNKKNDGTVILTFTEDIKADTVDGNIVVRDGENIVESTATVVDTNKVMVKLANPVEGKKYSVTVKREISKASNGDGMSNDKTFNILIDLEKKVDFVGKGIATYNDGDILDESVLVDVDDVYTFTAMDEVKDASNITLVDENGKNVTLNNTVNSNVVTIDPMDSEMEYNTKYTLNIPKTCIGTDSDQIITFATTWDKIAEFVYPEGYTKDDKLNVVFFGGSITNQNGWRKYTTEWFTEKFPDSTCYNSAIGGTGSEYGWTRLGKDVISKSPDVVFVEFAVNDATNTSTTKYMESIVRNLNELEKKPVIIFVYTTNLNFSSNIYAISEHEKLAKAYGIPTINIHDYVQSVYNTDSEFASDWNNKVYLPDGTHPSAEGDKVYGDYVTALLESDSVKYFVKPAANSSVNALTDYKDYVYAYKTIDKILTTEDSTYAIDFVGSEFIVQYKRTALSGKIKIVIDGNEETAKVIDTYGEAMPYEHQIPLMDLAPGKHTATITLLTDEVNENITLGEQNFRIACAYWKEIEAPVFDADSVTVGKELTATVNYKANSTDDVYFVIALYDVNGRLTRISMPATVTEATDVEKEMSVSIIPQTGDAKAKAFVWDSVTGMKALAENTAIGF